jgi:hypothetical protein
MPTISIFYGIVITMYWKDHQPPHFHAAYSGTKAIIDINALEVISGDMSRRTLSYVLEWAAQHKDELMENWKLCTQKQPPNRITPLG